LADELRIIPSFQVHEVLASPEGGMSKTYREWSPNQPSFFPPSPQDWLPEDDLVYFLIDTVATIDLSPIFAHYERERRGQPPFHPRMMVALLLYCYATGTRSSRKIMRRCQTDVACRVIVGNDIPDFRTISDFRKTHLVRLEALFVEVLKLCALAGLAKVGTISLDGTKVKANASRHKAMSYDRMQEEEGRLKQEIATMLAEAQAADATEDACHGPDRHGEELPEELARRQSRLAKIQQAKAQLEERVRAEAAAEAARREAEGKGPPKVAPADAVPEPKAQINFTDPESRIMKVSNKGWDQCGNAQAVANEHQIILAADVTDQANDKLQAVPMVDQARESVEAAGVKQAIGAALMDSGYYSETNTAELETRGIDPYVATERLKHHEKVASAPRGRIPKDLPAKPRMARKLRTKKGLELYAKRKGMIEPIFGQIKQVLGFRQFSLRGLASMRGEWRLMCVVHNLLKLWRHDQEVVVAG
jgi:transposase